MKRFLHPMFRLRFIFVPILALASSAACGSTGDETGAQGSNLPLLTGAGGGVPASSSRAVTATVGVGGNGGNGGEGGAAPQKKGPPYPVVLAHGFFGFENFAGLDFVTYFYGVKDALAAEGEVVYTPAVDPFNDSTFRGEQLYEAIQGILAKTGYAKVNIIGHSQGGLDARVVAHDHPDLVASVTTIATPHHGTPIADVALKLVSDPNAQAILDWIVKQFGMALYDMNNQETSLWKPLKLFSQPGIAAFNAQYPDAPGIPYFSMAGRSNLALNAGVCAPDVDLKLTTDWIGTLDPLDAFFTVTEPIMSGDYVNQHLNDGLVRVEDAKWDTFLGCVPADHLDEVGQLLGDNPGAGNDWDYQAMYRDLIKYLRSKGY